MESLKKILNNKFIKEVRYFMEYILNLNMLNRYLLIFSIGIMGNFFYNLEHRWDIYVKYNPIRDIEKIYESNIYIEAIKSIDLKTINLNSFISSQLYIIPFLVLVLFYIIVHIKNLKLMNCIKRTASFVLGTLQINALISNNWNNFAYLIRIDIFILLFLLLIEFVGTKCKKLILKKSDNEKIYENRKVELENFQRILEEKNTKKLILIDGSWGIGKSFFVKEALKKKTLSNYHKINLDILLFNDKKQIVTQTMNEINLILEKEGIRDNSSKNMQK